MTVLEFAQMVQSQVDTKSEIEFYPLPQDDPKQRRPDISRAMKALGWKPQVSFSEGLERTINFFRSHHPASQ